MTYNSKLPITSGNCPTRAALERAPGDTGFRHQSIAARHTKQKAESHARNLVARQMGGKRK